MVDLQIMWCSAFRIISSKRLLQLMESLREKLNEKERAFSNLGSMGSDEVSLRTLLVKLQVIISNYWIFDW